MEGFLLLGILIVLSFGLMPKCLQLKDHSEKGKFHIN